MTQFKSSYVNEHGEDNKLIRNHWGTPQWIFDKLNEVFDFSLDAAANDDNFKCRPYFTQKDNGLKQSWEGEVVFCNPPHSGGVYGKWIDKAYLEYLNHGTTSVLVLPFNWETDGGRGPEDGKNKQKKGHGFREVRDGAQYLILPHDRIRYDPPPGIDGDAATFYSCIAVFTWEELTNKQIDILYEIGHVLDLEVGLLTR